MLDTTVQGDIQKFFSDLVTRGQLSHAYCLVGSKNSDKRSLALLLAAQILGGEVHLHPDFLLIEQELNEKTGKTKRDIDIEQIKNLREFTTGRPFRAQHKVVIIDEAEKMNAHSGNSLLKTLEEPKGQTIFFLLTEDETQLLPTIRSRVQVVFLSAAAPLAFDTALVQQFLSLFEQPLYQKLKSVEELFGDKKDHIAARENLQNVLDVWEVVNRDYLLKSLGQTEKCLHEVHLHKTYSAEIFLQIHKKILEAKKYLEQNIHPRLLVEQILLAIP